MPYNQWEHIEEMPSSQAIEHHLYRASQIGLRQVRNLARKVLRENRGLLDEFVMGMGVWSFTTHGGDTISAYYGPHRKGADLTELTDFIDYWDDTLKLTGNPMRFTWDGPIVTDW